MLAERYLRRRFQAGKAEGKAEGLKEGEERGKAEAWEAWQAWNQRRLAAEKEDLPFNEPPGTNAASMQRRKACHLTNPLRNRITASKSTCQTKNEMLAERYLRRRSRS
jgi:hypothetical protein